MRGAHTFRVARCSSLGRGLILSGLLRLWLACSGDEPALDELEGNVTISSTGLKEMRKGGSPSMDNTHSFVPVKLLYGPIDEPS